MRSGKRQVPTRSVSGRDGPAQRRVLESSKIEELRHRKSAEIGKRMLVNKVKRSKSRRIGNWPIKDNPHGKGVTLMILKWEGR